MSNTSLRGGFDLLTNSSGATVPLAKQISLSTQEVTDLKKTLMTEWVTKQGDARGKGIIDTILNRRASGKWGDTVTDVVNARKQFSDVNGPPAWKHGRKSVDDLSTSDPRYNRASALVDSYLPQRAAGARSIVGDNLNYANRAYSTPNNYGWIDALNGPTLGSHRHGTTADLQRFRPGEFGITLPGQMAAQSIDPTVTGSIAQVSASIQSLGTTAQQASIMATSAAPQFDQAGQAIAAAGQQAGTGAQAAGQGLSELSSLAGMIPGAGPYMGMAQKLMGMFGLFSEGGIATDPVAYGKMPHYAEGTANTGSYGRGGIPSVLHPNEAVIPLSRGRKVPVEMNTAEAKSSDSEFAASRAGGNSFHMHLSGLKSADDFKKNQRQINAKMASDMHRAQRRNA